MKAAARGVYYQLRDRISAAGLQTTILYTHDLESLRPVKGDAACRVGPLESIEQLAPFAAFNAGGMFEARLRRGDRCYIGLVEDRAAHFSWVQGPGRHEVTSYGRDLILGPGTFCIYHCFTAGWARGKKLYPMALGRILSDYKAEGYTLGWIYTTTDNVASQNGIVRAGFVERRRVRALHAVVGVFPLTRMEDGPTADLPR